MGQILRIELLFEGNEVKRLKLFVFIPFLGTGVGEVLHGGVVIIAGTGFLLFEDRGVVTLGYVVSDIDLFHLV